MKPHTISVEDFDDFTFEQILASCGVKRLAMHVRFAEDGLSNVVYRVYAKGRDLPVKTFFNLPQAIRKYNEL